MHYVGALGRGWLPTPQTIVDARVGRVGLALVRGDGQQAGGLVDDQQFVVLVNDLDARLRQRGLPARGGQPADQNFVAGLQQVIEPCRNRAVDAHGFESQQIFHGPASVLAQSDEQIFEQRRRR